MSATAIYSAIDSKKYAEARVLISKELEITPKSPVYLGLLALLEFHQNNREKAVEIISTILSGGAFTLATISALISPILLAYNDGPRLSSAFEMVNRREPADRKLVESWIESMLITGYVKGLSKALTAANKLGSTRQTVWKAAFSLYMVYRHLKPEDLEYKLYPALARRMIEKYLPPKNPQEAYAYGLVLKMSSIKEMAEFVCAPETKPLLTLDLHVRLLEGLVEAEEWETLYEVSKQRLDEIDSYNYWGALNTSAVALDKVDDAKAFNEKFDTYNSALAQIDLTIKSGGDALPGIQAYWTKYSTKASTFPFLKGYLSKVPEFPEWLATNESSDLESKINWIKLLYQNGKDLTVDYLVKTYQAHIQELPKEKTDYFIGTDALMIAAITVLKNIGDKYRREKAAVILEYASKNDPSNFYARIWLIYIYRSLGAFAKARGHYDHLTLKSIQHDTMGYLMLSRAGSLYPIRPFYNGHLSVYEQADDIASSSKETLEAMAFTQIDSMLELQVRLTTSLSRALLNLEALRIERVLRGTTNIASVLNAPMPFTDNRDFDTVFDPRNDFNSLGLETGPRQGSLWAQVQTEKEKVYLALIRGEPTVTVEKPEGWEAEHTEAELWNLKVIESLGSSSELPLLKVPDVVDWNYFHTVYTILETVKVAEDFAAKNKVKLARNFVDQRAAVKARTEQEIKKVAGYVQVVKQELEPWATELNIPDSGKVIEGIFNTVTTGLSNITGVAK